MQDETAVIVKCLVCDGNERCCLNKGHPPPHMGRWYTMEQDDIDRFAEHLATLSDEQRKAWEL